MKCNYFFPLFIALALVLGGCDDTEEKMPVPRGSLAGALISDSVIVRSFDIALRDNTGDSAIVESVLSTIGDVLSVKCVHAQGWELVGVFQLPGSLGQGEFELYDQPFTAFTDSAGQKTYMANGGQLTITDHQRLDVEGWSSKGDYIEGSYVLTMTDTARAAVLRAEVSFVNIRVIPR